MKDNYDIKVLLEESDNDDILDESNTDAKDVDAIRLQIETVKHLKKVLNSVPED